MWWWSPNSLCPFLNQWHLCSPYSQAPTASLGLLPTQCPTPAWVLTSFSPVLSSWRVLSPPLILTSPLKEDACLFNSQYGAGFREVSILGLTSVDECLYEPGQINYLFWASISLPKKCCKLYGISSIME